MQHFKKILYLFTTQEYKQVLLLLVMMTIMALLEMAGVASILPFMAVVTNPDIIETNSILNRIFQLSNKFGVENSMQFLFVLGVFVFLLLIISLSFKALTTYVQVRFTKMKEYSLSKRIVENYLHQPYSWFLNRNSSDIGKTILSEVATIVGHGISPLMDLASKGLVAIALIILLILVDTKLAVIVAFTIGSAYGLIYYFTKSYLHRAGKQRVKNNRLRFMLINEAFSASKEVKVGGLEQFYIDRYSNSAKTFSKNQASVVILSQLPRYLLESIAFGGIMLVILYLIIQKGSFNSAIPLISLYVFAGYRLMPSMQQIFVSFNQLSYVGSSLNSLYEDLKSLKKPSNKQDSKKIMLNKTIALKNIYFNYPNSSQSSLKNININIQARTTVGLMGSTGSGKTTTIDVILGLLEAQKGTLEVDGQIITKNNCRAWQSLIGYVPQHIYLADDNVAANIAFGKNIENIDLNAVEKAAKIANLHDFIRNELPKQYQTNIGERGIRLSGGQKQRIGIARALYHDPQILILDEATSALDNTTENIVMEAIENLGKKKTIIIIAHRSSTVKNCDKIYLMDKGEIKTEGTFEELFTSDFKFQESKNH
tara:strand:+ start:1684 stop:3474 length:1791 start_codon:yes stop_codon:yes gene_type:complete